MKIYDLKRDITVCHVKHNKLYKVLAAQMKMKDSQLGWIDAVVYVPLYENPYSCFCRELNSFLKEFEIVDNLKE